MDLRANFSTNSLKQLIYQHLVICGFLTFQQTTQTQKRLVQALVVSLCVFLSNFINPMYNQ
jgi:xanthine/uracil permease